RQADPLRRTKTDRHVSTRSDGDTDTGETENPRIGRLAEQVVRALARRVADIAEDEEIPNSSAGEARQVGGLAAPKSFHEAAGGVSRRSRVRLRLFHLVGERRVDGDLALGRKVEEALRQVEIAGGERRTDFALRDRAAQDIVERP